MQVHGVMSRQVKTIYPKATLREAARKMKDLDVGVGDASEAPRARPPDLLLRFPSRARKLGCRQAAAGAVSSEP